MENINEIHWHDSEIESVIEIPAKDELIYNVQYPENWDQNIFVPKEIRFSGYHCNRRNAIRGESNYSERIRSKRRRWLHNPIKLETIASNRFVTAKSFAIGPQRVSI